MSRHIYLVEHAAHGRRSTTAYMYDRGAYAQLGRLLEGQMWSRIDGAALEQWISADEREVVTLIALEVHDA